jgi:hypothetical protein
MSNKKVVSVGDKEFKVPKRYQDKRRVEKKWLEVVRKNNPNYRDPYEKVKHKRANTPTVPFRRCTNTGAKVNSKEEIVHVRVNKIFEKEWILRMFNNNTERLCNYINLHVDSSLALSISGFSTMRHEIAGEILNI